MGIWCSTLSGAHGEQIPWAPESCDEPASTTSIIEEFKDCDQLSHECEINPVSHGIYVDRERKKELEVEKEEGEQKEEKNMMKKIVWGYLSTPTSKLYSSRDNSY